jgi:hypothetical protein
VGQQEPGIRLANWFDVAIAACETCTAAAAAAAAVCCRCRADPGPGEWPQAAAGLFVQSYFPHLEHSAGKNHASAAPLPATVVLLPPRTGGASAADVRPLQSWSCPDAHVWTSWSDGTKEQPDGQQQQQ